MTVLEMLTGYENEISFEMISIFNPVTHQSLCLPLEEGQDGGSVFLSAETFP